MIRVNILYPHKAGGRFDSDYYLNTHMPRSLELLAPNLQGYSVELGLMGVPPQTEPTYVALCHLMFESIDAFLEVFMPNADFLQGDIPNYTDIEPVIQFSEIQMAG